MNSCPPELHAYICQLTCVDDGYTVRSINKTSRYLYYISKPYLYQSLSVSGPKQIRAITTLLETNPKAYLRHIRYLFISDTIDGELAQATPETHTLISRIISLAAPTLESLSFIASSPQTSTSLIARLFRTSFPHLRDLTISGFYPFPLSAGKFPQLERLHLSGNRNPHGLLQMSVLDSACPSLKFLKISGLQSAASFVMEVQEAIQNHENEEEVRTLFPAKFPARVRQVTLQAGPKKVMKEANIQRKDLLMMKGLADLNIETKSNMNGVEVIVLDRSLEPSTVQHIKQEWLESIAAFVPQD